MLIALSLWCLLFFYSYYHLLELSLGVVKGVDHFNLPVGLYVTTTGNALQRSIVVPQIYCTRERYGK